MSYPQLPLFVFFSRIVQYRCMKLPKSKTDDNDRAHKIDANTLSQQRSMLLSGQASTS